MASGIIRLGRIFAHSITLKPGGTLTGFPAVPTAATPTTAGTVKQAAAQADSAPADLAALTTDFNALLAKLRAAGQIAP